MDRVVERFINYVSYDTQSEENAERFPSTEKQLAFARVLVEEMKTMGLSKVEMDQYGYVTAELPSNIEENVPTIGFFAHMDTADDLPGADIKPQIIRNYDGGDIVLNSRENIVLSPNAFPELLLYTGQDLITTDGTTLLGADDKAGIAEILTAMEYLLAHPEIKHGTVKVAFTPDEEVSTGMDHFDVARFKADLAYTVDGGQEGELEYESFNAAKARIWVNGKSTHTGTAKGVMINSQLVAMEFVDMLPKQEAPSYTEGYEGFFHLDEIHGKVDQTYLAILVRDHDRGKFEKRKAVVEKIAAYLNDKYGENTIVMELKDQYYNMREKIEPVLHIVDTAIEAMESVGVKPIIRAIRGGTDGSRLSFMGLPTPNLFNGSHNHHGRYEYAVVSSMNKAVQVIIKIIEMYGNEKKA